MPAQIARTGVLSERSKKRKKRAAGDLGQDPGEMATAGAQPALVRLRPDGWPGDGWRSRKLSGRRWGANLGVLVVPRGTGGQ